MSVLNQVFPLLAIAERLTQRVPPTAAEANAQELTDGCGLTAAEGKTMSLVVRGLTNPESAQVLGISANTVRSRLAVCFRKLGATRRTEAVFLMPAARQQRALSADSSVRAFRRLVAAARTDVPASHGLAIRSQREIGNDGCSANQPEPLGAD